MYALPRSAVFYALVLLLFCLLPRTTDCARGNAHSLEGLKTRLAKRAKEELSVSGSSSEGSALSSRSQYSLVPGVLEQQPQSSHYSTFSSSSESSESKKLNGNSKETMMIKSESAAKPVDDMALGLARTLSVDTLVIDSANALLNQADTRHEEFLTQHGRDCKGDVCSTKPNHSMK